MEDFYNNQFTVEGQIRAFIGHIKSDPNLIKALINKDFTKFASIYNGPEYKDNNYDIKMQKEFNKFKH